MAQVHKSEAIQEMVDGLRLEAGRDKIPSETTDKIVPVFDIKHQQKTDVVKNIAVSTASDTIYTTSATKDFYLTGVTMATAQNSTSDNTNSYIQTRLNNQLLVRLVQIRFITLTAGQDSQTLMFNPPILLAKNEAISLKHGGTAGTTHNAATIYGYELEP